MQQYSRESFTMQSKCKFQLHILVILVVFELTFGQDLNQLCTSSPSHRMGRCVRREHCSGVTENDSIWNGTICRSDESRQRETLICCPVLQNCVNCGKPDPIVTNRINGGSEVEPGSHSWATLLVYTLGREISRSLCGGVLINLQHVLTAAHCIEGLPRNWRMQKVRLGEWNSEYCSNSENESTCKQELNVRRTTIHDQYNRLSKSHSHDIALLQLEKEVTISQYVKPICLPLDSSLQLMSMKEEDKQYTVVGWGETELGNKSPNLLEVTVTGRHISMCNEVFRKHGIALSETQLCVGGEEGKDSCRGDSGGPLMRRMNDIWYLIGLVSFGDRTCGVRNQPSVYTNVTAYIDWIEHQLIELS
ncbi:CLIP domain-containing serine protease B15 [Aedes albopictus]|uniref:Peptidase S1 domain-containing protein n=1 Tax=Aedes albopictus TaxID=7160 RepID=A0ABM1XJL0_AEDAL